MATNPEAHFPVDKSVIIPAAVVAAGAAADQLMLAAAAPVQIGPPPPPAGHIEQAPPPAGGPPPSNNWVPQPQPQPVTHAGNDETWEQRFRSERGRRESVERAAQQREQAMQTQLNDVLRQVDELRTGHGPTATPQVTRDMISAEQRKTWGDDMCDFVLDVASKIAGASAGQVSQQVKQTLEQGQQAMWQREHAAMRAQLDMRLPDGNGRVGWQIVNDDPQFGNWLQERDGFSNMSRHEVLRQAWGQNDTETVYRIFAAYMDPQSLPAGQGGPGVPQGMFPPNGGTPQPSQRLPLNSLATPGPTRGGQASPPGAPEPNLYRQSEIAKFFMDKGRGVYNDTAARQQWATITEVDIFAAQKEGRVVPG